MFSYAFKVIIYLMVVSCPRCFAQLQGATAEQDGLPPCRSTTPHGDVAAESLVVDDNKIDTDHLGTDDFNRRNLRQAGRRNHRGQTRGEGGAGSGEEGRRHQKKGGGAGEGGGNGFGRREEMQIIQKLFVNRADINRTVQDLGDGDFVTETISERTEVAQWIQEHVEQMFDLVNSGRKIRKWDPLFDVIFDRSDELDTKMSAVGDGVIVSMRGLTPCGVSLAGEHAYLVSKFISIGRQELQEEHEAPEACA